MKKLLLILLYFSLLQKSPSQSLSFQYPVYTGAGLGLTYAKEGSLFRIWSPPAEEAQLLLYKEGVAGLPFQTTNLQKGDNGTWWIRLPGDWKKTFYAFRVKINNQWSDEVTDPYAKAVGTNGKRAVVIDLQDTNP
ncbi:MAG: type I pullulanase, partial [Ferruginibacter sp.]